MTSSLKPITSNRSPSWNWMIPLLVFAVLMIHGALLGVTDDEAYYWVLAQRPALGYAFHPPAVAWSIALTQKMLGWLLGTHSSAMLRFPAALMSALIVAMGMQWMRLAGVRGDGLRRGALGLLSFCGFFAASWMMVPDLPLFAGWMLLWLATWKLCFGDGPGKPLSAGAERGQLAILALGTALSILSKYSAVLAVLSSAASVVLWARPRTRWRAWCALALGLILAAIPILVWNAQHEWASILYQIRDRHQGGSGFSGVRYLRFWAVQLFLAGPALLVFAALSARRSLKAPVGEPPVSRFTLLWAVPAALVFCVQPGWSDFKAHWAFAVWLPFALELGWQWGRNPLYGWARAQAAYGLVVTALVFALCHFPATGWITWAWSGKAPNPLHDVTNDMFGWGELASDLESLSDKGGDTLPVLGSRYQTASQAAFAIGDLSRVSFVPRDAKQKDEWLDLGVSEGEGPEWPRLRGSVLFVADNRYDAGPAFPEARCERIGQFEKKRYSLMAKRLDVWRCDPLTPSPK